MGFSPSFFRHFQFQNFIKIELLSQQCQPIVLIFCVYFLWMRRCDVICECLSFLIPFIQTEIFPLVFVSTLWAFTTIILLKLLQFSIVLRVSGFASFCEIDIRCVWNPFNFPTNCCIKHDYENTFSMGSPLPMNKIWKLSLYSNGNPERKLNGKDIYSSV